MKFFILSTILLLSFSYSDVIMKKTVPKEIETEEEREKERSMHPILRYYNTAPVIVHQDNYYQQSHVSNCDKYIDIITRKNNEIRKLTTELNIFRAREGAILQKKLKAKHHDALQEFEKHQSSIHTTNSITISKEPIK